MQRCFLLWIIALATGRALAEDVKPAISLRYSCFDKPFLSASVSTERHDSFPDVEVRLLDAQGRPLDNNRRNRRTPKSQQGKVIEIPGHPATSQTVAAEICEAGEGDYALLVSEHADGQYWLSIDADDGIGNEGMDSSFFARKGQTCTFRFRVRLAYHVVNVRWLSPGNVQTSSPDPTCELAKKP